MKVIDDSDSDLCQEVSSPMDGCGIVVLGSGNFGKVKLRRKRTLTPSNGAFISMVRLPCNVSLFLRG